MTERRLPLTWPLCATLALVVAACVPVTEGSQSAQDVDAQATRRAPPTSHRRIYEGLGFDTCDAPSSSKMSAWLASPYRAVGIYIGGNNRGCKAQPNLTPTWITTVQAQGWKFLPLYVGYQAPAGCNGGSYARISADPAAAAFMGAVSAEDAANQAINLGIDGGSPIYFDLEAYTRSSACSTPIKAFVNAWTVQLHRRGYLSGFYSSSASGIADQVAFVFQDPSYRPPDAIWFAHWNNDPTLSDPDYVPDAFWSDHQRHHQYWGGHPETWGGVLINIDNDSSDGPVAIIGTRRDPPPVFFGGDGPPRYP